MKRIILEDIIQWICSFKEFSDRGLVEKRHAIDAEYIKSPAIKAKIVFDNGDQAICRDRRVYLYSDSVFGNTPEGINVKMEPDPFK